MLAQQGKLRALTQTEYESLHDSIQEHGVQNPILLATVEGNRSLIDGYHRYLISDQLGTLHQLEYVDLGEITLAKALTLAVSLNADRRQLTIEERKILADAELMRDHNRSNRMIASIVGLSHPTVAARRAKLIADQKILDDYAAPPDNDPLESVTRTNVKATLDTAPDRAHARPDIYPEKRVGRDGITRTVPQREQRTTTRETCPHCNGRGWIETT